jgi:hypothetical protein
MPVTCRPPIDEEGPMKIDTKYDTGASDLEDSLEELQERLASQRSATAGIYGSDVTEGDDLAAPDILDIELTVPFVPKRDDEFTCDRCFLVRHHSQRHRSDRNICHECA